MPLDISDTLAPNSDQLDAVDLLSGPRIFTVASASRGNAEQPVNVHLVEFPRVWRPGKSMRRVLANCWGKDAADWTGRRVELYCDPEVQFGGQKVGGTRISRLSHIDKPVSTPLLVTRGKSAMFKVEPLKETDAQKVAAFKDAWKLTTDIDVRAAIEAEVAKLQGGAAPATATDDAPAMVEDAFPKDQS